MNMKKTIAAVAASALAISAIAVVPASAEVADAAVAGTKFTYKLAKTYDVTDNGKIDVQSQATVDEVQTNGFYVSLENYHNESAITITASPAAGTSGTPWNPPSFVLAGKNQTFVPAGISVISGVDVTIDGTIKKIDFLYIAPGAVSFTGDAIITVKGTVDIVPKTTKALALAAYGTQTAATTAVRNSSAFKVYAATGTGAGTANDTLIRTNGAAPGGIDLTEDNTDALVATQITNDVASGTAYPVIEAARMTSNFKAPSIQVWSRPLKTTSNGGFGWGSTQGATPDVIKWLQGDDAKIVNTTSPLGNIYAKVGKSEDGIVWTTIDALNATNNYVNVQAVLNDCITSYDNVTFTFNTATDKIINFATDTETDVYGDNWYNSFTGFYQGGRTWMVKVTDKYMTAFGQSVFNNYGTENSAIQPFDPNVFFNTGLGLAYNLFSGALIVNDNYTMQLADTNVFTYNATSLTFDWQSIKDNIYTTTNTYLDLIWTMKLATSIDWYWDSLDVAFAVDAGDTGESEAPVTEDDELIDEEITDAPVDEPTDELPEVLPEEPVAPAANPGTGNAPIALAVIPVALAAAAIIAKKRK
jgi:hypothetical protein